MFKSPNFGLAGLFQCDRIQPAFSDIDHNFS